MLFPFPPKEEQSEIVSHITSLDIALQGLAKREVASRNILTSLIEAAFGEP